MDFIANFICFPVVQSENLLRFDKVTESLKVGTCVVRIKLCMS